MLNVRLLDLSKLTPEQRDQLVEASRKVRPDAEQREEFAALVRRWREYGEIARGRD
jgi:hypothetical protein